MGKQIIGSIWKFLEVRGNYLEVHGSTHIWKSGVQKIDYRSGLLPNLKYLNKEIRNQVLKIHFKQLHCI